MENGNLLKGSLFALAGFFCMAVFGIMTKMALAGGSALWVSFLAYLSATLALTPFIAYEGVGYLRSEHYPRLLGRALFGSLASFLYTVSIKYIPIVNGTLLFNTAPVFIPLLVVFWLKKDVAKKVWYAVLLGFIGIIIIIKPTEAIFTQGGNLIGLASGFSLAIAYLLMKLLTDTDPRVRIIFYYLGIGMLVQLPLLFFAGEIPNTESCLWAIGSGVVLMTAQICLVNAYKYAEASQVGIYQYSSVVFVGIIDYLIWGTVLGPQDLLGIILVVIAGSLIIRS